MKLKRKALIEQYGSGRTMPANEEIKWRTQQVLAAKKGLCTLYPFLPPPREARKQ